MMTIDRAPTIVNLFGIDAVGKYVGNDVFAPGNEGFAYFETWGWLDNKMYYVPSKEELAEKDMEYIEIQNRRVRPLDQGNR